MFNENVRLKQKIEEMELRQGKLEKLESGETYNSSVYSHFMKAKVKQLINFILFYIQRSKTYYNILHAYI